MTAVRRQLVTARVAANEPLGAGFHLLRLGVPDSFDVAAIRPGRFVMLRGPWRLHPLLPRAFSILDGRPGELEILIKVVGRGTRLLAELAPGEAVTVLGPLGNAFPWPVAGERQLLVGGGSGIPPLALQASRALQAGLAGQVEVIYGGRAADELVLRARLKALGVTLHLCTDDGSLGRRGLVTGVLAERIERPGIERVLACGPLPMLRAVGDLCRERSVSCHLSLESEMACGVGLCRGCAVARPGGGFRCTCLEGPVMRADEVEL